MSYLHQDPGIKTTGRKTMLATTSYGSPDDSYTFSIQGSRELLHKAGIQTAYLLYQGNCHVDDARNRVVQEFLMSDCDELVFLDSDISWGPPSLVQLCEYQDVDVVGALAPYRRVDKLGTMPVMLLEGGEERDGLVEVEGIGTAFLRIKRHVIERLAAEAEHYDGNNALSTRVPLIFQRTLINGTRWGGDLHFCNLWRKAGGRVYCDPEIVLGHAAKVIIHDSMGAFTRRITGRTLRHVCMMIEAGKDKLSDYAEARRYVNNDAFGATLEMLALAVGMARKADKPIIEAGSGLTTILMAAATDQVVYCLEHSEFYAQRLREMAIEAGVENIGLCVCPIKEGWYDLTGKTLPNEFSLGLNDGPPRIHGSRKPFMDVFGDRVQQILCDDADDLTYRLDLKAWADERGRESMFIEPRMMLLKAA